MISIKVKTASLELELSSDASQSLTEVASEFVKVAQSAPIQNSIHAPILLSALPPKNVERQLPLFGTDDVDNEEQQVMPAAEARTKKRLSRGTGQEAQAYNNILEMIPAGFFDDGKNFAEITSALAKAGYNINSKRLADALLRLVREKHLVREGERRKYIYKKANGSPSDSQQ